MDSVRSAILLLSAVALIGIASCKQAPEQAAKPTPSDLKATINWDKTTIVSKSTPTLQVVVNAPLEHGKPLSVGSYSALKDLGADYVRYVPWLPYPKLGVAELEPPTKDKTSWDFSLIDPMTKDFLAATEGHLHGDELLHHPAVDVQDRQADSVPRRSRSGDMGLRAGHRAARPQPQRDRRLLQPPGRAGTSTADSKTRTACSITPAITTNFLCGKC